jgi:NitT/TauT family transport system permease protein
MKSKTRSYAANGLRRAIAPVAFSVGLIALWEIVTVSGLVPPFILPSPSGIVVELWTSFGGLAPHMLVTAQETFAGLVLSVVIGVPLAVAIAHVPWVARSVYPLLVGTQALPKVALAPLIIIWVGFGFESKVLVAFLVAFFPLLIATIAGFKSVDNSFVQLGQTMKASRWRIFLHTRVPIALPQFFSGLKIASTFAVTGAIVGEFIAADAGLGYRLLIAFTFLQTELMFAILVLMAALGMFFFYAVELVERLTIPWHVSQRQVVTRIRSRRAG